MSFFAVFEIGSPVFRETLDAVPGMLIETEDIFVPQEGGPRHVFWATGDDFDAFESALVEDSTVETYSQLTKLNGRRLYRVDHTEAERRRILYRKAAKEDIVYLDAVASTDGVEIRAQVPSREALKAYRRACVERDIPFELQRLYQENSDDLPDRHGLTAPQWDVLVRAHERGYFRDPRETTLEELAEEFDVTASALGRRLRRAQDTLIEQAVRSDL